MSKDDASPSGQSAAPNPTRAKCDDLSPGTNFGRTLPEQDFNELKANLRENGMYVPICVIPSAAGRFAVVDGHNRLKAAKELGWEYVPIYVMGIDADAQTRAAFFANLLRSTMSDLEKYVRFRLLRDAPSKPLSQAELARISGFDPQTVSRLFSFEGLPLEALQLLEEARHDVGTTCVIALCKIFKESGPARVLEAVTMLVNGELTQDEAIAHAAGSPKPKRQSRRRMERTQVEGYCSFITKAKSIVIDFKDASLRSEAATSIEQLLRDLAARRGGSPS